MPGVNRPASFVLVLLAAAAFVWWLLSSAPEGVSESPVSASAGKSAQEGGGGTAASEPRAALLIGADSSSQASSPASSREGKASRAETTAAPVSRAPGGAVFQAPDPGAKTLDAWHRALPEERSTVLAGLQPAEASALDRFSGMWSASAAAYADSLRLEAPTALGPAFRNFAAAFAHGGLEELANALSRSPDRGPAWRVWEEALAARALREQAYALAGRSYGRLIPGMLAAGYKRERVLALKDAVAELGDRARDFLPYEEYPVVSGDSLIRIRGKFQTKGVNVQPGWIVLFNHKRNTTIRLKEKLKIPTTPLRVEVWRDARIEVVFAGEVPVRLYSVSVGKQTRDTETPLGSFTVGIHEPEPVFWRQDAPALPFGHPDNPLGTRWLGFKEETSYGFHGTNSEATIGGFETLGCIRMHNRDVEELYSLLPDGARIVIHP